MSPLCPFVISRAFFFRNSTACTPRPCWCASPRKRCHHSPSCIINASPSTKTTHFLFPTVLFALSLLVQPTPSAYSSQSFPSSSSSNGSTPKATLIETSRRNTRLTGKISRQFTSAKRAAERGDLTVAENLYTELIESPGGENCAPAFSNRANLRVAKKRYQEALHDYDHAIDLAPVASDTWIVLVNRGATRLALTAGNEDHNVREALADMNRALELRGSDRLIWFNRAAVYEVMGKWDNALADYQRAVEQSSNDIQPFWFNYALVLHQRGKSYEALTVLNRVASKFGNRPEINAAKAGIHYDRGELVEAETNWSLIERPKLYKSRSFLAEQKRWPPKIIDAIDRFRNLKE